MSQTEVVHVFFYMYQVRGPCAGMCTSNQTYQMEKAAFWPKSPKTAWKLQRCVFGQSSGVHANLCVCVCVCVWGGGGDQQNFWLVVGNPPVPQLEETLWYLFDLRSFKFVPCEREAIQHLKTRYKLINICWSNSELFLQE